MFDGSSIIRITLDDGRIRFLDTYRFLQMSLDAMPKAFGIADVKKGFFPYSLNNREYWDKKIEKPDFEDFEPNLMNVGRYEEFKIWYREEIQKPWEAREEDVTAGRLEDNFHYDIFQEMKKYCEQDVHVLRVSFMKFLEEFYRKAGVMPAVGNMTIASLCNIVWHTFFLKPFEVGLMPYGGYVSRNRQSKIAISWLAFLDICHCNNRLKYASKGDGEKKLFLPKHKWLRVDGYLEKENEEEEDLVFEFYGCVFHGCPKCTPPKGKSYYNYRTFEDLYTETMNREQDLHDAGYKVVSIFECEWKEELSNHEETRQMYLTFVKPSIPDMKEPMSLRDGLFGGRVDAYQMIWEAFSDCIKDDAVAVREALKREHIKYFDVTSEYPFVNKYGVYPVGHPYIIRKEDVQSFHTEYPLEKCYFGIIYCRILPLQQLFHPVLPCRIVTAVNSSKLVFILYRSCAMEFNFELDSCNHTESERSLEGVWTTTEVDMALEMGYKILDVFEIWNYPKRKKGLFAGYIDHFLKGKQEAAGWPSNCDTPKKERNVRGGVSEGGGYIARCQQHTRKKGPNSLSIEQDLSQFVLG